MRTAALALTAALTAGAAGAAPAPAVAAAPPTVASVTSTTADPGLVVGSVPPGDAFAFLGPAGSPVWADLGAGFDSPGGPVRLVGVDGPGEFHAYTLSGVGTPTPLLGGGRDAVDLPAGRTGAVWAFTAPGDYTITLDIGGIPTAHRVSLPADAPPAALAAARAAAPEGALVPAAAAAAQADRKVIAKGHVDMGPRFVDGAWTVQLRDDTASPPAWRDLADTVLHVVDQAAMEVPADDQYRFLGDAGERVWLLPQAEQAGIVWPGWNTQDPSVVSAVPGEVTWTIRGVDGPGRFGLFLTGSFGQPQVLFDPAQPWPQQLAIPRNTHAHGNWFFTASGTYRLDVEMSATTGAGEQVRDTATVTVFVGPGDPAQAYPPPGTGDNGSNGNGGGGLPLTGGNLVVPAIAGAVLVAAGAALLVMVRRRRSRA